MFFLEKFDLIRLVRQHTKIEHLLFTFANCQSTCMLWPSLLPHNAYASEGGQKKLSKLGRHICFHTLNEIDKIHIGTNLIVTFYIWQHGGDGVFSTFQHSFIVRQPLIIVKCENCKDNCCLLNCRRV